MLIMSATLPSFADRRRQARKPGKCEAELRFKHFFKERTVLVSMINVSTEALSSPFTNGDLQSINKQPSM